MQIEVLPALVKTRWTLLLPERANVLAIVPVGVLLLVRKLHVPLSEVSKSPLRT